MRRHRHSSADLRALLADGDRRSIARSKQALELVHATPERVAELVALAEDPDWLVSMRAVDLLEKIAHEHADWVNPYKKLFIRHLADSDKWEIRLQIVRALPLLRWTRRERERVILILRQNIEHPQKIRARLGARWLGNVRRARLYTQADRDTRPRRF